MPPRAETGTAIAVLQGCIAQMSLHNATKGLVGSGIPAPCQARKREHCRVKQESAFRAHLAQRDKQLLQRAPRRRRRRAAQLQRPAALDWRRERRIQRLAAQPRGRRRRARLQRAASKLRP